MAMVSERVQARGAARTAREQAKGNGPGGRRLGYREDVPLTAGEAARLEALYAAHAADVLLWVRNRLMRSGTPWLRAVTLAEDIAENTWLLVMRQGRAALLMGELGAEDARRYVATYARNAVSKYWALSASTAELPTDFEDPQYRALPAPEVEPEPDLTPRCEELLSLLSPELRAAMVEVCHGMPVPALADRLGISGAAAHRLIERAVRTMRGETLRPAPPKCAPADTPPAPLEALPAAQREALEALPETTRMVLLLRLAGLSYEAIGARVGRHKTSVAKSIKRYARILTADSVEVAA